jgi:hypothetical protein
MNWGEVLGEPRVPLESFQFEQPRRNAVQALLASGLAVAGLSSVIGSGSATVKKQKKKNQGVTVVLGSSQPYDVAAGASTQITSTCPTNSTPISVSVQIADPRCWISNSLRDDTSTGWIVRVSCLPGVTTTGTVRALCLK